MYMGTNKDITHVPHFNRLTMSLECANIYVQLVTNVTCFPFFTCQQPMVVIHRVGCIDKNKKWTKQFLTKKNEIDFLST